MNEADLVQQLVLQFLQHDGYVDSARAFAEDIKIQKEALNMDPNVKIEGINIKDDEDADKRQRMLQPLSFLSRLLLTHRRYTASHFGGGC